MRSSSSSHFRPYRQTAMATRRPNAKDQQQAASRRDDASPGPGAKGKATKAAKAEAISPVTGKEGLNRLLIAVFLAEAAATVWAVGTAPSKVALTAAGTSEPALLAGFTALTVVAVWASQWCFEAGGRWLSRAVLSGPPFNNPLAKRKTLAKFKGQSWQLIVHCAMGLLGGAVLAETDWLETGMAGVHPPPPSQQNSAALSCLYMAQLAIWIYTCACHIWLFEYAKDYWVM